jgi:hypothetical protein
VHTPPENVEACVWCFFDCQGLPMAWNRVYDLRCNGRNRNRVERPEEKVNFSLTEGAKRGTQMSIKTCVTHTNALSEFVPGSGFEALSLTSSRFT